MRHGYQAYCTSLELGSGLGASTSILPTTPVSRLLQIERYRGLHPDGAHPTFGNSLSRKHLSTLTLIHNVAELGRSPRSTSNVGPQFTFESRNIQLCPPPQVQFFSQSSRLQRPKLPPKPKPPQNGSGPQGGSKPPKSKDEPFLPETPEERDRLLEQDRLKRIEEENSEKRYSKFILQKQQEYACRKAAAAEKQREDARLEEEKKAAAARRLLERRKVSERRRLLTLWKSHFPKWFGPAHCTKLRKLVHDFEVIVNGVTSHIDERIYKIEQQRLAFEEQKLAFEQQQKVWLTDWEQLASDTGKAVEEYERMYGRSEGSDSHLDQVGRMTKRSSDLTKGLTGFLEKKLNDLCTHFARVSLEKDAESRSAGLMQIGVSDHSTSLQEAQKLYSIYWNHIYLRSVSDDLPSDAHRHRRFNFAERLMSRIPGVCLSLSWYSDIYVSMLDLRDNFQAMSEVSVCLQYYSNRAGRGLIISNTYQRIAHYCVRAKQSAEVNWKDLQTNFDNGMSYLQPYPPTYLRVRQAGMMNYFAITKRSDTELRQVLGEMKGACKEELRVLLGEQKSTGKEGKGPWLQGGKERQEQFIEIADNFLKYETGREIRGDGYMICLLESVLALWDQRTELVEEFGTLDRVLTHPIEKRPQRAAVSLPTREATLKPVISSAQVSEMLPATWLSHRKLCKSDGPSVPVHYVATEQRAAELADRLKEKPVLGLDILSASPALTMQMFDGCRPIQYIMLASDEEIVIIHLTMFRFKLHEIQMSPAILRLLTDPGIVKVGTDVERKLKEMSFELGVCVESWKDIDVECGELLNSDTPAAQTNFTTSNIQQILGGSLHQLDGDSVKEWPYMDRFELHYWSAASLPFGALEAYYRLEAVRSGCKSAELSHMSTARLGPLKVDPHWVYAQKPNEGDVVRKYGFNRGRYLLTVTEMLAQKVIYRMGEIGGKTYLKNKETRLIARTRIQAYYLAMLFEEGQSAIAEGLFSQSPSAHAAMCAAVLWAAKEATLPLDKHTRITFVDYIRQHPLEVDDLEVAGMHIPTHEKSLGGRRRSVLQSHRSAPIVPEDDMMTQTTKQRPRPTLVKSAPPGVTVGFVQQASDKPLEEIDSRTALGEWKRSKAASGSASLIRRGARRPTDAQSTLLARKLRAAALGGTVPKRVDVQIDNVSAKKTKRKLKIKKTVQREAQATLSNTSATLVNVAHSSSQQPSPVLTNKSSTVKPNVRYTANRTRENGPSLASVTPDQNQNMTEEQAAPRTAEAVIRTSGRERRRIIRNVRLSPKPRSNGSVNKKDALHVEGKPKTPAEHHDEKSLAKRTIKQSSGDYNPLSDLV